MTVEVEPGGAGAVAALGDRARRHEIYDSHGAPVYHALTQTDRVEIRELLAAVRRGPAGPVLELGCGSGRLTLPLLALGRSVTALDLSPTMLELLAAQFVGPHARLRSRCSLICADMAKFRLPDRFAVVVLGTITISLFTPAERVTVLEMAVEHLAPGGRLLISTVACRDDAPGDTETVVHEPVSGRTYQLFEHVDRAGRRDVTLVEGDATGSTNLVRVFTTHSWLVPAETLCDELAAAGLQIRARHPVSGPGRATVILEAGADR